MKAKKRLAFSIKVFGERIKQLRLEHGYRQEDVADMMQIGRTTALNHENGNREPSYDDLYRYAALYGVTTDYLLGKSDERFPAAVAGAMAKYLKPTGDRRKDRERRLLYAKMMEIGLGLDNKGLEAIIKVGDVLPKALDEADSKKSS
ncbi:MAG: helix-turn-helix transcriptional regulator [bacterium]